LAEQVIGYREDPQRASGVVYREDETGIDDLEAEHHDLQSAARPQDVPGRLYPADRKSRMDNDLYRRQVAALAEALRTAVELYATRNDRADYGRILGNLPEMTKVLSWERSVEEYRRWYDLACR
jgi:hypothetical protein